MIPLHESTTRTLIRVIDDMQDEEGVDLTVKDHPQLRLQRLDSVQTPEGEGYTFAIGQLRSIDPPSYEVRMILIVIDDRDRTTWTGPVSIYPVSYHDEVNGVSEMGALIRRGTVQKPNPVKQRSLSAFAYGWVAELDTAGYFQRQRRH